MKKLFFLFSMIVLASFLSGCMTMKENQYAINQLKSRMMNVENALARHNLIIQQNKAEIDTLYDKMDELASNENTQSVTNGYNNLNSKIVMPKIVKVSSSGSSLISSKLNVDITMIDVQKALRNAGFYLGGIDGKIGPLTKNAIKRFQKANNLYVDGIIGNKTWNKLRKYL